MMRWWFGVVWVSPEVWRFDAEKETVRFWLRRDDGSYALTEISQALSVLRPADVNGQIRLADELGSGRWSVQLGKWVQTTLLPRRLDRS